MARARLLSLLACVSLLAVAANGFAQAPSASETDDLFNSGKGALEGGRPADAIAAFEALADRGILDPTVSFDRALAYAERVRRGAGQPGDLGQAAHGFEEARDLSSDDVLDADAARGLVVVRGEVARRKARAGEPVDLDKGDPLGRAIVRLAPEWLWERAALLATLVMTVALIVRRRSSARRVRLGAAISFAVTAPALVALLALTLAARHERLDVRDGVVISAAAHLADERGIALAGGATVPEGARVRVVEARTGLSRIVWGTTEGWLQAAAVRPLAHLE